jgi:hypothetical protein
MATLVNNTALKTDDKNSRYSHRRDGRKKQRKKCTHEEKNTLGAILSEELIHRVRERSEKQGVSGEADCESGVCKSHIQLSRGIGQKKKINQKQGGALIGITARKYFSTRRTSPPSGFNSLPLFNLRKQAACFSELGEH